MDLKKQQKECVDLLADLDLILKSQKISYFLFYGSLLGAIRHKGFIPWDDDIDIALPYEDYVKLLSLEKKLPKNMCFDKEVINYSSELVLEQNQGNLKIDVFLFEKISSNKYLQYLEKKLLLFNKIVKRVQLSKGFLKDSRGKYGGIKLLKILFLLKYFFKLIYFSKVCDFIYKILFNTVKLKKYDYVSVMALDPIILTKKDIFPIKFVSYENVKLPILNNYHKFLTFYFGDYMKLPPKHLRKPHHIKT